MSPGPPGAGGLGSALDRGRTRLHRPLTLRDLADRAGLSNGQPARRTRSEPGASPLDWLRQQRLVRARELRDGIDATVGQVAARSRRGTPATVRRHFRDALALP